LEQLNLARLATKHCEGLEAMVKIIDERMAARIEGDFVVFIIGMRINKLWKITK
jgi:hypothetical protein